LTGIAIKHLAQFTRLASADEIFVAGLFSHIGQLALATVYSDAYGALLARTKESSVAQLHALQQQEFGFDEAQLGEAILADMNFPKVFQMLVRYCDQPENNQLIESSRDWRLLHLMHIANLFADLILVKPAMTGQLAAKIRKQAGLLAIAEDKIAEIGDDCVRDWEEWSALLGMNQDLPARTFAELLAAVQNRGNQAALSAVNASPASLSLRVLVVEDDATMLKLLQAMLHTAGYSVLVARNGLEAMGMIKQHQPQLVVSDLMMPEMDGISLCRHLRASEQGRNTYIVILTAQENPEKLIEAFEAGADDYLLKPIMPKIFFARMRAAQRVIQMQAELAFEHEQLQRLANELKDANQHLQKLASTDVLTGLPNRRAAMERLDQEWSLARRSKRTLACMILDIDHFKSINDKFGHPVGDLALKSIAQVLRSASRTQDMVCRFGGEEFLVICPDTDIESAYQCAERLRVQVAATRVADIKPKLQMTISIGIAVINTEMVSMDELLNRADKCLYAAKQAGRNQIIFEK
jgi:diguanylate cyclase (GGDEF)-like protein